MPRKRTVETRVQSKNLEMVFFPADGFTKGDLLKYYSEIAPVPRVRGGVINVLIALSEPISRENVDVATTARDPRKPP